MTRTAGRAVVRRRVSLWLAASALAWVLGLGSTGCTGAPPPGPDPSVSSVPAARSVSIATDAVRSRAAEAPLGVTRIAPVAVDGATVIAPVQRESNRWQLRRSGDAGRTWTEATVDGATTIGKDVELLEHRPGQWLLVLHDPADVSSRYTIATSPDGRAFTVVGHRLDLRADESLERVLGTRAGWVLITSAVRADRTDLLRTRRSANGGGWDGAVEIEPTANDFALLCATASPERIALGGVTVVGRLADRVFRGAIVTSTDGGRTFVPGPVVNADDDYARVDALQYSGDTLIASIEAKHSDVPVRTEWAQFRGRGATRDVVDEVRRAPSTDVYVSRTDEVNATEALSLSGSSRLLVQRVGSETERRNEVYIAGGGTAPFSPVSLPPGRAGSERFIRTVRPVPGGHLLAWTDYAGGMAESRIVHVDPAGRVTDRTPILPASGEPRAATVLGTLGREGTPLLGQVGHQSVILDGPPGEHLTVRNAVNLPDGNVVDRIAPGPGGYVATGWKQNSLRVSPAIFSSRDGVTWRSGESDPLDARRRGVLVDLSGLTRTGPIWMVVGSETAEGVTRGVALVSADGSRWTALRPTVMAGTITDETRVNDVVAGRPGQALAGGSVTVKGAERPVIFVGGSTAGSWRRTPLELPSGSVSGTVHHIVEDGVHRVAAGWCPTATALRYCTWNSGDQGATWTTGTLLGPADPKARIVDVALFATGHRPGIAMVEEKDGQRSLGVLAAGADGRYGRRLSVDTTAFTGRSTVLQTAMLARGQLLLSCSSGPEGGEKGITTVQNLDPVVFDLPGNRSDASPQPTASRPTSAGPSMSRSIPVESPPSG